MPLARRFTIAIAVLFAASAQLVAQGTSFAPTPNDQSAPVTGAARQLPPAPETAQPVSLAPALDGARVGVRTLSPAEPFTPVPPRRERTSSSVGMMIIGGAVLIVGAVVGGQPGTIIMIGGGVVGIIGLIRYLQ